MPDAPTNDAEVLSNINENMVKLIENIGSAQIEKFSFFLKNGTTKKYSAIVIRLSLIHI